MKKLFLSISHKRQRNVYSGLQKGFLGHLCYIQWQAFSCSIENAIASASLGRPVHQDLITNIFLNVEKKKRQNKVERWDKVIIDKISLLDHNNAKKRIFTKPFNTRTFTYLD